MMKKQLQDHFDFFCKAIGIDIKKLLKPAKSRKLNPFLIEIEQMLFQVYKLLNSNKTGLALHQLSDTTDSILHVLKGQDTQWLIDNIDMFKEALTRMKEIKALHNVWLSGEFTDYLRSFHKYGFFQASELTPDKVSPNLVIALQESEISGLLNPFKYATGKPVTEIPPDIQYRISEKLYMVESFDDFFFYLKNNKLDENILHVHFLMKIEQRIELTYFILSFSYQGNVWFISDLSQDFSNPLNKASTRRPERRREKYYDSLALPYELIDQIAEIRKKGKQLVKLGEKSVPIFTYGIAELPVTQKLFFISLVQRSIPSLPQTTTPILTLAEHVDQKLLSSGDNSFQFDASDTEGFESYESHISEISNELIEYSKTHSSSTALVKVSKDLIVKNSLFDKDWIGTPKQLETIVKWMVFDSKANEHYRNLKEKESLFDKDRDRYDAVLNKPANLDKLWKFLFSGEEVFSMIEDGLRKKAEFGFEQMKESLPYRLKYKSSPNRYFPAFHVGMSREGIKQRADEHRDNSEINRKYSYDKYVFTPVCPCCKKVKAQRQFDLNVVHYKQLMMLIGESDREKLPEYFRFYRSAQLVPYHGNSILENVHPFAMLTHPSWEKYKNGIYMRVYLCVRCVKALTKKYFISEKTVIMPDLSIQPFEIKGGPVYSVMI